MHKPKRIGGSIISSLWNIEKSDWRLSFRVGLVLGLIIGGLAALVFFHLFGFWMAVLGFIGGVVIGTFISTLAVYILVSTTSILG